jgi:hypothetical protein
MTSDIYPLPLQKPPGPQLKVWVSSDFHCAEYFLDFISDRMRNWRGMNDAAATTPSHIDIQYIPPGHTAVTWPTAEGLSELLTVLNTFFGQNDGLERNAWCCSHNTFTVWHLIYAPFICRNHLGHSWRFEWAAHCLEYFLDFILNRMMYWRGMDVAADTRPLQFDI